MKWFKIGLLAGLVIATAVGFTFMRSLNKGYKFYYYPQLNAYYDVQNENYVYSIDGAKTWDTITKQSDALPNNLGKKVTIHSDLPQAWLQNDQHREKYGGMLNDLIGASVLGNEKKNSFKRKREAMGERTKEDDATKKDSIDAQTETLSAEIVNDEHAAQAGREDKEKKQPADTENEEEQTAIEKKQPDLQTESDSTDL